jgi:putative PIN family toxin of toxin-antitoxin system
MLVCIDSNVLLGMFSPRHASRPIFNAWFEGRLRWAVSTEILLEYEEILQRHAGQGKADVMMQIIALVKAKHGNFLQVSPSFRFHLITADADDNKFADCAIAAEADFIITEDHHFDVMRGSGYRPQPITPEDFIRLHLDGV